MRAAGVVVSGALDDRDVTDIKHRLEPWQVRMQPERPTAKVGTKLQHARGGHGLRWTTRVVGVIRVGHKKTQRVVAATQIEHDQVPARTTLRQRHVGQEPRHAEAKRERRDPAFHKRPSTKSHAHMNWYSDDPASKWTRPADFAVTCGAEPVQTSPALT